ncbi:MAG TPA: DNA recombination protein RmuC [Candidatus Acidoferrales bacterium]|nr:DNA recombination protein RmuC [Candidatus Acidoferrales bacterium]
MADVFPISLFVVGIALGALAIWLLGSRDARTLDKLQSELTEAVAARARLEAQLAAEKKSAGEQLGLLQETKEKFTNAFSALSAEALRSNNQAFLDLAKATLEKHQIEAQGDLQKRQQAIESTLKPMSETLQRFDEKVGDLERKRSTAYEMLNEQLKTLQAGTAKLERALRTPSVRGRWGEIQLRRVVEIAGMTNYCDFQEQPSAMDEDKRLRPDLLVKQPGGKTIVVDAKVPLEAYLNSLEASSEKERRSALELHAHNVRTHMKKLAEKSYWQQFEHAPEFVVMFLPGEMLFSAALEVEPELIEAGVAQRVIPASPTTLIALLRAVSYGWKQEAIAHEAHSISALGGTLYKRLSDLARHFFEVGRSLERTMQSYNKAIGSLEGRVLVSARKFREYESVFSKDEIVQLQPVETEPRQLTAPELAAPPDGLFVMLPVQPAGADDAEDDLA